MQSQNDTFGELTDLLAHHEHKIEKAAAPILFAFLSVLLGATIRVLMKRWNVSLPYTVVLFVCGVALGTFSYRYPEVHVYTTIADIEPKLLLHIFLPILIFESAFAMDAHVFLKSFGQCMLLAFPGLIFCAAMTAFLTMNLSFCEHWSWNYALLLGIILSATDPVAVVALLRDVGTSAVLTTIIDGEALLNDGSAIVIYEILVEMIVPGNDMNVGTIIWLFVKIAVGGPLLGFVIGHITVFGLVRVYNDAVVEITLTLASAYVTYYLAEMVVHVSGVLAVVVLGVVISANKAAISPEMEKYVHSFWEMMAYFANTLIFVIVGVIIGQRAILFFDSRDLFLNILIYVAMVVFRLLMIGILSPIMVRLGYGLTWQDVAVITWGGLRGAVGLALALSVSGNPAITEDDVQQKILIHVSGIVILTLLVNATTCKYLLQMLGMNSVSQWKHANMLNAVRHLQEIQERALYVSKTDSFLCDADWNFVDNYTTIQNPYKDKHQDDGKKGNKSKKQADNQFALLLQNELMTSRNNMANCLECSDQHLCVPSLHEYEEMLNQARVRFINALKVHFWRQFESGLLQRGSFNILIHAADSVLDSSGQFITISKLRKHWEVNSFLSFLNKYFAEPVKNRWLRLKRSKMADDSNTKGCCWIIRICQAIITHPAFLLLISGLLLTDISISLTQLVMELTYVDALNEKCLQNLQFVNIAFVTFYALEFLIKITGLRCSNIYRDIWDVVDSCVLIISIIGVILEIIATYFLPELKVPYIVIPRLSRFLRLLNVDHIWLFILPLAWKLSVWISKIINQRLLVGYDISRGLEQAYSELVKVVDRMIHHKYIANAFLKICNEARLEAVREMADLQERYPETAVAVKTRRAARHVLNNAREELKEINEAGLLDDSVYQTLYEVIESKMRQLIRPVSRSVVPVPPLQLLKNVPWIGYDANVFEYFKTRAQIRHFSAGSNIFTQSSLTNTVYIITFGVVRVDGVTVRRDDGLLPNVDSYRNFCHQSVGDAIEIYDLFTVGYVIGELGVLTKRPKELRAFCETEVKAFEIEENVLRGAMVRFKGIKTRMWRNIALRIAREVLSKQPRYEHWPPNKIMLLLDDAVIPELVETSGTFFLDPSMEDVVLVQGVMTDNSSGKKYLAPCRIPNTACSLNYTSSPGRQRTILVINGDGDYDAARISTSMSPSNHHVTRQMSLVANFGLCLFHEVRRQQEEFIAHNPLQRSWSESLRNSATVKKLLSMDTRRNSVLLPKEMQQYRASTSADPDFSPVDFSAASSVVFNFNETVTTSNKRINGGSSSVSKEDFEGSRRIPLSCRMDRIVSEQTTSSASSTNTNINIRHTSDSSQCVYCIRNVPVQYNIQNEPLDRDDVFETENAENLNVETCKKSTNLSVNHRRLCVAAEVST